MTGGHGVLANAAPAGLWAAILGAADRAATRRPAAATGTATRAGSGGGPVDTIVAAAMLDGVPRLGWVRPHRWGLVEAALRRHPAILRAPRVTLVGTGGWAFGAEAARDAYGGPGCPLSVVSILDPAAVEAAHRGPVVAVSESGTTLETALLAAACAGRDGRRAAWLTGAALSPAGRAEHVAMFGAPLSLPFLLAAAVAAGGGETGLDALGGAYDHLVATADRLGLWAATASLAVGPATTRIRLRIPAGLGSGMYRFALSAARQGLAGPPGTAGLWIDVDERRADELAAAGDGSIHGRAGAGEAVIDVPAGNGSATVDGSAGAGALAATMVLAYATVALVACVGLRRGVRLAEHPAVNDYKRRIGHPAEAVPVPHDRIVAFAAESLSTMARSATARSSTAQSAPPSTAAPSTGSPAGPGQIRRAHLVCYDPVESGRLGGAVRELSRRTGHRWEVHAGSTWNHHSYQAVHDDPGTGVVLVAPAGTGDPLSRAQAGIAAATHLSLRSRSRLLRPVGDRQEHR